MYAFLHHLVASQQVLKANEN